MLLVTVLSVSGIVTANAVTVKDDEKYTLILTCGLNGMDGKVDGDYAKMIKFDAADGDTTVSLSELTAGMFFRSTAAPNSPIGQRIGRAKQKSQRIYLCRISIRRVHFG